MTFTEILSSPFLTALVGKSLVVGILVSLCASLLGVSLVLKRYSMIGDGLSHVGFFALALAAAAGVSGTHSLEASLPIVILAAVLILRLSRSEKINGDAACAIVSTGAVAIGTLINNLTGTGSADVCSSLFGSASIVTLSDKDLGISIVLSAAVLVWYSIFARQIFAVTFDETFARSAGCRTEGINLALAVLTGVTIVLGMKMMGALMISALILFPPMTAMRLFGSFRSVVLSAAAVSVVCFLIGFFLACWLGLQTGATVVTVNVLVFCIVSGIRAVLPKLLRKKTA